MTGRSGKVAIALAATALLVAIGCTKRGPATSERSFGTPDEAVAALVAAVEADDVGTLQGLLGPGIEELLSSGDAVSDRLAREAFLRKFRLRHQLVAGGPDDLALQVGDDDWPLPIPLVRHADGSWQFDGAAGAQELILRRIGRNELQTIDVMRGYVAAQEEYAAAGRDGLPAGNYAQRLRSQLGKHDGLYWEASGNEPPSPAGPLLAAAAAEGYDSEAARKAYHGYVFRMLYSQGPAANGGAREYVRHGQFAGGFALLATPALYGVSGVMTFIVNQDGVVWQRDLGDDTPKLARAIDQFDPDASWTPIAPDG